MTRTLLVMTAILIGSALPATQSADANGIGEYNRASAAIGLVERSGLRLELAASSQLTTPRAGATVYAHVVATEASLDFFIAQAGALLKGDIAADLQQLAEALDELKELKAAKAALLGHLGDEARTQALSRALATAERVVDTARHIRTSLDCLLCDTTSSP